jgi:hypothetical protein
VACLRVGDHAVLQNLGSKSVKVQRIRYDENGAPIDTEWKPSTRTTWAIKTNQDVLAKPHPSEGNNSPTRATRNPALDARFGAPGVAIKQVKDSPKVRRAKQRSTST